MKIREESLARLGLDGSFDVVILGGGVNGVAVLRELALNGVSAVLLERSDFCRGASGASSRMAHGGLRYLENREFALVAESTRERNRLLRYAPHFVRPLETVVPLTSYVRGLTGSMLRFFGLSKKGGALSAAALIGALQLYEFLGRVGNALPRFRAVVTRRKFPAHLAARFKAVISYFDARITNPEALVMEMIEDALSASPSVACLNHIRWTVEKDGGFVIEDPLSGQSRKLRPKLIVNAGGAWIDSVNASMGLHTQHVRPVKGAHLLLRHEALHQRMAGKAYYFDDGTGRMVICYPLDRTILLGTTELPTENPDDETISAAETTYLLSALNTLFTDIKVTAGDIVSMTTGMRPLQRGTAATSANRAARDHLIAEDTLPGTELPVLSLVGGKWTTFRSFGEQVADRILAHLGLARRASTQDRPYPGAIGYATPPEAQDTALQRLSTATGLPRVRAALLLARYGATAFTMGRAIAEGGDWPLATLPDYSESEILWLIHHRAVIGLDDLIFRRTQIALDGRCTEAVLRELGALLGRARNRTDAWVEGELRRCRAMPTLCLEPTPILEKERRLG